jgi:hypothetical protein
LCCRSVAAKDIMVTSIEEREERERADLCFPLFLESRRQTDRSSLERRSSSPKKNENDRLEADLTGEDRLIDPNRSIQNRLDGTGLK